MRGSVLLLGFIFFVVGCSLTTQTDISPTAVIAPTSTPEVSAGWTELAPGLTTRKVRVEPPYASLDAFDMVVVRVDPAFVDLRVHYEPTILRTLPEWKDTLPTPLMIINGSFFTAEGYAVGLVVTDGQSYGRSLEGYGGMLQISGEAVRVRSLVKEPYQGEIYQQVVQGFPMFVQPGGEPARTGDGFDDPSRRTIVAQETSGHILFMITENGLITLRNALNWLVQTEHFEIEVAFGLDGGKSTGMYLVGTFYPSIEPVPVVIAAYSR